MHDDAEIIADDETLARWWADRKASGERGMAQMLFAACVDEMNRRTTNTDLATVIAKLKLRCPWATEEQIVAEVTRLWPRDAQKELH